MRDMGPTWKTPWKLIAFGAICYTKSLATILFVLFVYGKRQRRPLPFGGGLILLVYPYFVHSLIWMVILGVVIIAAVWIGIRLGL